MQPEYQLAKQVASHLNQRWPEIVYHFDVGSGARLPMGLAMKQKHLNRHKGWPDLFIASDKIHTFIGEDGKYYERRTHGLFIELKVNSPYLKDGKTLKKDDHLHDQYLVHEVIRSNGYEVHFGVGFEDCKRIIDNYLSD